MQNILSARRAIEQALFDGAAFDTLSELVALNEALARLITEVSAGHEIHELVTAGLSRSTARIVQRRADNPWEEQVPVEHQDLILSALDRLTPSSPHRLDIYSSAANVAPLSSPKQTYEHTKKLVREENERLAQDPFEAHRQRSFRMHSPDEHGGIRLTGYVPPADAALLRSLMNRAFGKAPQSKNDLRTVQQRSADAFGEVLRWASSDRTLATGHASLVVSVTDTDELDWRAKFATNTDVDLSLFDMAILAGDRISDYIAVHDHNGAVKQLVTGERCANFYQRIALIARDLVCQHPGCDEHGGRCDVHHIVAWNSGGATALDNLALLCRAHHRRNDDHWVKEHLEIFEGMPWWVEQDGSLVRNNSPVAKRSGGRRSTTPTT